MTDTPQIIAFAGSTRKDSYNKKLVKIAAAGARAAGAKVTPAVAAVASPGGPSNSSRHFQRSMSSPATTPNKGPRPLTPPKQLHAPAGAGSTLAAAAARPYAQRQQQLQQGRCWH